MDAWDELTKVLKQQQRREDIYDVLALLAVFGMLFATLWIVS